MGVLKRKKRVRLRGVLSVCMAWSGTAWYGCLTTSTAVLVLSGCWRLGNGGWEMSRKRWAMGDVKLLLKNWRELIERKIERRMRNQLMGYK